jgi:hypothetical protein
MRDIYFLSKDNEQVPFADFLISKQEELGLSIEGLSELVDAPYASVYRWKHGTSAPSNKNLKKIINGLGYSINDFKINRDINITRGGRPVSYPVTELGNSDYESALRAIGDLINAKNEELKLAGKSKKQKLSSSILHNKGGNCDYYHSLNCYVKGATTEENYERRVQIHNDLINLDPKYSAIELHKSNAKKNPNSKVMHKRNLIDQETGKILGTEDDLIHSILGETLEECVESDDMAFIVKAQNSRQGKYRKQLPPGIQEKVIEKIKSVDKSDLRENRSEHTMRQWITNAYNNVNPDPIQEPHTPDDIVCNPPIESIDDIVLKKLKDIEPGEDEKDKIFEDPGKTKISKEEYFKIVSRGHSELVAYLIDPDNYKSDELFGQEYNLIYYDFSMEDLDNIKKGLSVSNNGDLGDKVNDLIKKLDSDELITDKESEEAINFVNNWLRCDLIYKSEKDGGFLVTEVKQNAKNSLRYLNADKTRQQLAAYMAVILDNIESHNKDKDQLKLKKEKVQGVAIAYTMDDKLKDFLNSKGDRKAITVEKEKIKEYISGIFEISTDLEKATDEIKKNIKSMEKKQDTKFIDFFTDNPSTNGSEVPIVNSPTNGDNVPISEQVPNHKEKEYRSMVTSNGQKDYDIKTEMWENFEEQILCDSLTFKDKNGVNLQRFRPFIHVVPKQGNSFIINLGIDQKSIKQVFLLDDSKVTMKKVKKLVKSGELGENRTPNKFLVEKILDEIRIDKAVNKMEEEIEEGEDIN